MTERVETARLELTPLTAEDAEAVFAYRSLSEVARYQWWEPASAEEVRARIAEPGDWLQLGVRLRDSGKLAGDVGVHVTPGEPRQAEIGFTIAPDFQRRGFATEAVEGLLGRLFGELGMHRVWASADPRNAGSLAVLRRAGMRQEAHFRESLLFKGAWADDVVFALLESEWRAR